MSDPTPTGEPWTALTVNDLARYDGYKGVADAHNAALAAERRKYKPQVLQDSEARVEELEHELAAERVKYDKNIEDWKKIAADSAKDNVQLREQLDEQKRLREENAKAVVDAYAECDLLCEQLDAAVVAIKRMQGAALDERFEEVQSIGDAALAKIGEKGS